MLDIDDAILATTAVTPGKLSWATASAGAGRDQTLTIANNGRQTMTYALSSVDALAVAGQGHLRPSIPSRVPRRSPSRGTADP